MAAILQLVDGVVANRFEIEENGLGFGRSQQNQVVIDDRMVSSQHAEIRCLTEANGTVTCILKDLGSTNGSFVNEQQVSEQVLHHKDVIRIGLNNFTFVDEEAVDLEKTAKVKKSWIPGVYYSDDS